MRTLGETRENPKNGDTPVAASYPTFPLFFPGLPHNYHYPLAHGLAILEAIYRSPLWWVTFLNNNQPRKQGHVGESHLCFFKKSAIEIVRFASRAASPRCLNCIAYKFNKYPLPTPDQP